MENFHWLLAQLYGPHIRVVCTGLKTIADNDITCQEHRCDTVLYI